MAHRSYLPASESALIIFLGLLAAKLALHAMAIGVTVEQLKLTQRDIAYCLWIMQYWNPAIQQYALEATIYKNMIMNGADPLTHPLPVPPNFDLAPEACPPGALTRLANLIQRIKLSDGYTDAIGQDLGIISTEDTTVRPVTQLTIAVERNQGLERVKVLFTKYEHHGISLESRRNNGAWEFLCIAMTKPCYDERPLLDGATPEVREYRATWWDNGSAHGDFSPVQRITVGP